MGFFDTISKDKSVIEIQKNLLRDPGTIIFFQIGQQIRDGESIETVDKEGILDSIEVIREFVNQQMAGISTSEDLHDRAVLALTIYSVIKFGYDSEKYAPNKIIMYSKKLYIRMTGTPDNFLFEQMHGMNQLKNKLTNQ